MRKPNILLTFLLALLLTGSSMAFSGHASSHSAYDSGLCSLCVHPGGPDTAITTVPGFVFILDTTLIFSPELAPVRFLRLTLYIHQSRAPPRLA